MTKSAVKDAAMRWARSVPTIMTESSLPRVDHRAHHGLLVLASYADWATGKNITVSVRDFAAALRVDLKTAAVVLARLEELKLIEQSEGRRGEAGWSLTMLAFDAPDALESRAERERTRVRAAMAESRLRKKAGYGSLDRNVTPETAVTTDDPVTAETPDVTAETPDGYGSSCVTTAGQGSLPTNNQPVPTNNARKTRSDTPSKQPSKKTSRRRSKTALPADWQPTDAHRQRATELGLDMLEQAEAFKASAEAHDRRYADWDAAFRNWLVNAPKYAPTRGHRQADKPKPKLANLDAALEWLRVEWTVGRTKPIEDATGLRCPMPAVPLHVGRDEVTDWLRDQNRAWITAHRDEILARLTGKASAS